MTASDAARAKELIDRYLLEAATAEERAELQAIFERDPTAVDAFARAALSEARLDQFFKRERMPQGQARERGWRRRALAVGSVAGLVACAVVAGIFIGRRGRGGMAELPPDRAAAPALAREASSARPSPGEPPEAAPGATWARVERTRGDARILGDGPSAAAAGATLRPGAVLLLVGRASEVALRYRDGTSVSVGGEGTAFQPLEALRAPGKRLFIAKGTVTATVARQPAAAPMVLSTPHADVTVLGTRLSLQIAADSTRLDVDEGRARLVPTQGGDAVEIGAGRYAVTRAGAAVLVADRPPGGRCLYVYGGTEPNATDRALQVRLEKLGFEVQMVHSSKLPPEADVLLTSLVVISSTSNAAETRGRFREVAVPLITWESVIYDDLGLVESCALGDCGRVNRPSEILIKDDTHPLARGLSGLVRMSPARLRTIGWGSPTIHAAWVATVPGNPTQAVLFAYEKGAAMAGLTAPARRVALPLNEGRSEELSEAGYLIFENAVSWSTEGGTRH